MDAAASMIEKAIIANPTYAEAYNNLGIFFISLIYNLFIVGSLNGIRLLYYCLVIVGLIEIMVGIVKGSQDCKLWDCNIDHRFHICVNTIYIIKTKSQLRVKEKNVTL